MTGKQRKWLTILLLAILLVGVGLTTYLVFFNKPDQYLRVKDTPGSELAGEIKKKYANSALKIHPYGAFEIQIVITVGGDSEDEVIFVGVGTFTKTKTEYVFTFVDSYSFDQSTHQLEHKTQTPATCPIVKGKIAFEHENILYYFG